MNIEFTQEQLQLLSQAISELPYRLAAPLIAHISKEIQKNFDAAADDRNDRSGQAPPADEFRGD